MADIKVTALSEESTPISTDIVMLVDDPGGSAASKKLQLANLSKGLALNIGASTATTYTFAITDSNNFIRFNNASTQTITIPPNSSVAFSTGTRIWCMRQGAGAVTLAAGAGVTIASQSSYLSISARYGVVLLVKLAANTWNLSGDLS